MLYSCGNNSGKAGAGKSTATATETAKSAGAESDKRGYIVKVGRPGTRFRPAHGRDGSKVNIKELQGKVVMLQFTASWCGVCRQEMPHIESEIWQKLKDNPEFALYGIDLKETPEVTEEFAKSIPVTYPPHPRP